MIAAIKHNDVEKMKLLLASGESVNVTHIYERTPLEVAVKNRSKDAFNFLLNVDGIQLEPQTGLLAIERAFSFDDLYFAEELMKRGLLDPSMMGLYHNGNTLLHDAVYKKRKALALCLLKNGANMNSTNRRGETPLMIACKHGSDELVSMLLYYGADTSIRDLSGKTAFEHYRKHTTRYRDDRRKKEELEYVLLETTFDDKETVNLSFLWDVMLDGSPWFPRLLEKTEKVRYDSIYIYSEVQVNRIEIVSPEYFELFITKFPHTVKEITRNEYLLECLLNQFKILIILCEHDFGPTLINYFSIDIAEITSILRRYSHVVHMREMEGIIFYLLSCGLSVQCGDFYAVYSECGYSSLFKLMLHLDHNFDPAWNPDEIKEIMCSMIVDYTVTFRNFPYSCHQVRAGYMRELLNYSSAPKLKAVCLSMNDDFLNKKVEALPQVPSLLELARDSFRESLAKHCQRTQLKAPGYCRLFTGINSNQFYTTIQNLRIPDVCKKVLTYERKLYE